jgi:hypothetical protein
LQKLATDALADFQAIEKAGTASPRELLNAWLDVVDKVDKAAFKKLPEGWQASSDRMVEIAKKLGVDLAKPVVNAYGEIEFAGTKAATAIDTSWLQTRGALERAKGAVDSLEGSTRGLSETAIMLGHALNAAGEEVNAYGNAIARLSEETQRLMDLRVEVETPFGSTIEVLQDQLRQANRDLLDLSSRMGDLGIEGFRQQQQILLELIAELEKRIAELQARARETASTTDTKPETAPAPGTSPTPGAAPTAPSRPVTSPGTVFAPTSPILVQRPGVPTSGTGSLVLGSGPGGGGQTPGFPVIGTTVSPLDSATQRGVTVNVTLNAQMLTADRATLQQTVNTLAPAINEAIRRGAITP